MFKLGRWATGPGQHPAEMYECMSPALQLISLLLCEEGPLLWYSRLTFGERRLNSSGQVYLVPTPYCITPQAISVIKANLNEFAKVVTFMFAPPSWQNKNWGTTYLRRESMSFFHEFNQQNFPPVPPGTSIPNISIVLSRNFEIFFRKTLPTHRPSLDECYNALFMFASVMGHEVAHGYYMFMHGSQLPPEPIWDNAEKSVELGFSWEWNVFGCIPMPLGNKTGYVEGRFPQIAAIKLAEYQSETDHERIIRAAKAGTNAQFTKRDANGTHRTWPSLEISKFRGYSWSANSTAIGFVASVYSIRPRWLIGWFQQTLWRNIKTNWTEKQYYLPPSLGESFVIIYNKNASGAYIERPLHPSNEVDVEILRNRRAEESGLNLVGMYIRLYG
jgi:hypothetical protein